MEVIKEGQNKIEFKDLVYGDVFYFNGIYYLRIELIEDIASGEFNAVDVECGVLKYFHDDARVAKIKDAYLMIN